MPNTLSYNQDRAVPSGERFDSRYIFIENKQEFEPDGPKNAPIDGETAQTVVDSQRDIEARTALAKEVAVSYTPEVHHISEQKQYEQSVGHAAVRTAWFRQEQLTQHELELAG